jgi:hypothetical protein
MVIKNVVALSSSNILNNTRAAWTIDTNIKDMGHGYDEKAELISFPADTI